MGDDDATELREALSNTLETYPLIDVKVEDLSVEQVAQMRFVLNSSGSSSEKLAKVDSILAM